MASWIRASLKKPDQKLLDLKKRLFQYKHLTKKTIEEDGPLMLKLVYDRINPSTRVGVRNLISKLFKFNLKDYDQDVPKMADEFEATYNLILEKEDETVKPEAPFFDALLTSTNEDFNTGIKAKLTKWESGEKITFDDIKADAIVKYNNICERLKKNNQTFDGNSNHAPKSFSKDADSDKAKIIALTTQLEQAQKQLMNVYATNFNPSTQSSTSNFKGAGKRKPNIEEWRMKKTFGPKVERDGKWWYWCEHHKYPGYYDGLYVTHPPEKHQEWQDHQDKMKGRGKYANKQPNSTSGNDSSKEVKLVLSDSIQQALVTDHGFTPLQLEQLKRSGN